MKNGRGHLILGDPGAANREDRMFLVKVYYKIEKLFFWAIGSREFKCLWNWFGKIKSPAVLLDLTVKFHQEHSVHL